MPWSGVDDEQPSLVVVLRYGKVKYIYAIWVGIYRLPSLKYEIVNKNGIVLK